MSIPSHILDQLNSQADLVSIIGRHTTLKKAGNEYKGCCPFHGEKSPSFYVNPQKNMYHCFGCGAGGNAIGFLKDYENLTFIEAVNELGRQTGIDIPQEDTAKVSYQRNATQPRQQSKATQQAHKPANTQTSKLANWNADSQKQVANQQATQQPSASFSNNTPATSTDNDGQSLVASTTYEQPAIDEVNGVVFTDDSYAGFDDSYGYGYDHDYSYADFADSPEQQNFIAQQDSTYFESDIKNTEGNLYELLNQVHQFYQNCLQHNHKAQDYFRSRGLTAETIETFGLGYAPTGWQHLEEQFPNDIEGLKILGLVRTSEKGRDFDLLRDRVIFVIRDNQGRVIGFAGRALDNEVKPKYINSSDSPVFHKQHVLYGYYESRQKRANDWLVVEGYMDVIALYQAGIYGAVASMGTAINEAQITRLLNLNPVLTLSFDGDSAGQKAAWRTLEVSLPILTDDKELRFLTLPDNHDPDTYVSEHGVDAMQQQISQATPLSEYVYQFLSTQHDLSRPEGKAKLMSQVRSLTNQLPKGSSFRSLLNNDIYQKLSGRRKHQAHAQNLLVDFSTKLTLSINLCLCLLYQPSLLLPDPIQQIWQVSGVEGLKLTPKAQQKLSENNIIPPSLPNWQDFEGTELTGKEMGQFIHCLQQLLPHLPKDANAASHFIFANLPSQLQLLLSPHWQGFYASLLKDNVIDIEPLFQELLIQQLLNSLQQQQKQTSNIYVRDLLNKRRTKLLSWQKN